jgi:hypothetical protein
MGKNWNNLVVTDKFNITGRGVVLIVDFIKSGLCTEVWEKELPKIDSIDSSRNTFNGRLMTRIGVLV